MSDRNNVDAKIEQEVLTIGEGEPHPADLLANLMRAESGRPAASPVPSSPAPSKEPSLPPVPAPEPRREEPIPAAARALAAQPGAGDAQDPNAMQRTMVAIRNALPLLQKLLPLLDGNVLGAVIGMLAPHPHQYQQPQPAQKPIDFSPVESGLSDLKRQHHDLRSQIQAQDAAMKRLAEQLDQVRDATERNTREQEDLVEELKVSGKRMNIVAFMAFALLAASIAMNVVLYLQIHKLLP